jgi:4-hydroxyphenylacetate 3-monooxygenase
MQSPAATKRTPHVRPFTRKEYLESLRDNREVWIYGERVKYVTKHPAFRNSAQSIARLYDALHDPAPEIWAGTFLPRLSDIGALRHPFPGLSLLRPYRNMGEG